METLIFPALAAIGFFAVWITFMQMRDHVRTHGAHNIIGRFLSGRRTDGKHHTNASFWRKSDGRTIGHPIGRVSQAHHRAGISNMFRRLGYLIALILTVYGFFRSRSLTEIAVIAGIAIWGIYRGYRLIIRLRQWYTHQQYITPLAAALGPQFDMTGPEIEEDIHMQPGYTEIKSGAIGRIDIPPRFHTDSKGQEAINHLIGSRLPVDADFDWRLKGKTPHILIKAAPSLPSLVRFADYITDIEALQKRQYIPGIDRMGKTFVASFAGEEPHHGYCWGSGRGKSTSLKNIIAQIFHNEPDATGTVIDPKDISLDAFVGIPGLDFYNDSGDIPNYWAGITKVYDLMMTRYAQLKADPTKEFPTHLLIMEEANSFSVMSKVWWQRNKPKGAPAGVNPPVWADAIAPLFWRGRQAGIFIILVAQSVQERFMGNLNLRPSLGMLSMSGYKVSQWQNYVGTFPVPKSQKGRGRAIYIDGETETWVQNFYGSDQELRDFAMHGRTGLVTPTTKQVAVITGKVIK
jgi:hypothetical protein